MSDGVRETQCTNCIHREVCLHKQDFLDICNAVFGASVYKTTDDEHSASMKKVTNYDCLGAIAVTCRYYRQEVVNPREGIF